MPPETPDSEVHVEAKIVSSLAPEFDINSYEAMETDVINSLGDNSTQEAIKVKKERVSVVKHDWNEVSFVVYYVIRVTRDCKLRSFPVFSVGVALRTAGNEPLKTWFKPNRRTKILLIFIYYK